MKDTGQLENPATKKIWTPNSLRGWFSQTFKYLIILFLDSSGKYKKIDIKKRKLQATTT